MSEAPLSTLRTPEEGRNGPARGPDADVRECFLTLAKALRAHRLYEQNNPVYLRFVSSLRDAFRRIWREVDVLTVEVDESRLLVSGSEVYANENRSESLAFLFYRDGLRRVTFYPGIEEAELERFLGVLQRALHAGTHGDDLVSLLWEEGLECFHYRYVDPLAEAISLPERGAGAEPEQLAAVREQELGAEGALLSTDALQTVGQDGFNPTLYSLSPGELQSLGREISLEMERDLRRDVLAALFDRLEEPHLPERQAEILGIFRALLPNLLGRGELEAAASVLEELRAIETRLGVLDEQRRRDAEAILDELSAPDVVQELVRALEEGALAAVPDQLGALLLHMRPRALPPLIRASETVEMRDLRPVLQEAVKGIAGRNRAALMDLLAHGDPVIAAGAARLAGKLQLSDASPALNSLLEHPEPAVRLAAVEAAQSLRAATLADALQRSLSDGDRDVRIAAARALGGLHYLPAAARFRDIVTGRAIRKADVTEKVAVFESYGELGDGEAVPLLDKLLNGKNLLGRREPTEIRASAALALGRVATPAAHAVLQRSSADPDPVVRSAVGRALRHEPGAGA